MHLGLSASLTRGQLDFEHFGGRKVAHSNGALLECGSLLPPSFGEACFADAVLTGDRFVPAAQRLELGHFGGRGSKLPQGKAQASLRTPRAAS
jgi:hypothetical protein